MDRCFLYEWSCDIPRSHGGSNMSWGRPLDFSPFLSIFPLPHKCACNYPRPKPTLGRDSVFWLFKEVCVYIRVCRHKTMQQCFKPQKPVQADSVMSQLSLDNPTLLRFQMKLKSNPTSASVHTEESLVLVWWAVLSFLLFSSTRKSNSLPHSSPPSGLARWTVTVNFTDAIIILENYLFTVGVDKTLERQEKSDGRNKRNSFFHNPCQPTAGCVMLRIQSCFEFYFITFLRSHFIGI